MEWEPYSNLNSPFEWRWTVSSNAGLHTQRLQIDYKGDVLSLEDAAKIGIHCWRAFVAPLLCHGAQLEIQETIGLGMVPSSRLDVPPYSPGGQPGAMCDPDLVPVWVTHTVDADRWARRPIYFPGSPADWVSEGVLTPDGIDNHLTMGKAFILGFGECWSPGTMQAIRFRPGSFSAPPGSDDYPAFKKVLHLRVCHHCDRPTGGLGGP